ncbi:fumarylacetoacetate hydrolase family protein [Yoonia sp. 208BN28-4]|uniref:fumarylacetoacetate hydrolase family protein n=1 Tax=Yoonia sp. 208BN28-4 TaxID=3126505 RepID=UPI0030B5EFF6
MDYIFPPQAPSSVPVKGESAQFPVNRVFCVGRNYAAHAAEMGGEVDREAPWYFMKSATAVCASGQTVPYPPGTSNFHYEMELAVALGGDAFEISTDDAMAVVYGYACALDMTRRDRQQDGKDNRRPWDLGKDIENGAVIAPITKAADLDDLAGRRIQLAVNGDTKQDATLDDMVWSVAEIISHLSRYYHLQAGDMILTGTPAGVGPVVAGDVMDGQIDGLDPVQHRLSDQ